MSLAKKSVCVVLCVLFSVAMFSTKACAIAIDGMMGNAEWKDAAGGIIFPSVTAANNDIEYAYMKRKTDRSGQAVYIGLQMMQKTADALKPDNTAVGVRLTVKTGTTITCRISGTDEFDRTAYSVDKCIVVGTQNDCVIELRIGYLFGVPENPLLGLQLIDSNGKFSNYYSIPAAETTATTATSTAATTKPSTTKPTTTAKPATTKTPATKTTAKPAASTTKPITGGATAGSQSNGTSYNNNSSGSTYAADSGSNYSQDLMAVEAITGENGEPLQSTDSAGQNSTAAQSGTQDDLYDVDGTSNESGGIGIKKQIAAVSAAVILIALAVILVVKAAKVKPGTSPEPAKPPEQDDEEDTDDDF